MAVGQSLCVQIEYVKLHIYCIHISLGGKGLSIFLVYAISFTL